MIGVLILLLALIISLILKENVKIQLTMRFVQMKSIQLLYSLTAPPTGFIRTTLITKEIQVHKN
jgi:hypothetical protein